jgi:hypothetical protein
LRTRSSDPSSALLVADDRPDRAAIERFFAAADFLRIRGLPGDEGMRRAVVPLEKSGSVMAALVAVNAFVADEERTGDILGVTMDGLGHEWKIRNRPVNLS